MTKVWILIFLFGDGFSGGENIDHAIEFNSKESCLTAKSELISKRPTLKRLTICVEK